MDRAALAFRSRCIRETRRFFEEAGYLEVDTPVTSVKVIPEPTIDLMTTKTRGAGEVESAARFLLPSPEYYMKRLLASGSGNIFQFSRCFRNGETPSALHANEFLMLEWYSLAADYYESLSTTETLMDRLARIPDISPAVKSAISPPFIRLTVAEAFSQYTGIDLASCGDLETLTEAALVAGFTPGPVSDWAELFHWLLVSAVEPGLPEGKPVVLLDYPSQVRCLAKEKPGTPWRERWELYLSGG
jgi:lysyl-tRNA synthetase class 2